MIIKRNIINLFNDKHFKYIFKNVSETLITRFFLIGISIISGILIARMLGPVGKGILAIATTIAATGSQFGNLGLHSANTYFIARDRSLMPVLFGNTLLISFVWGGIGCITISLLLTTFTSLINVKGYLLILAMLWIPFDIANMLSQNLILGVKEVRYYNLIELIANIFFVLLLSLLFLLLKDNVNATQTFAVMFICLIFKFILTTKKLFSFLDSKIKISYAFFKNSINYGYKAYISAFCGFMIRRVDLIMIDYYKGGKYTGLYAIAVSIIELLNLLPQIIGVIIFPLLCEMKDWNDRLKLANKISVVLFVIMAAISLCMIFVAKPLIVLMYGIEFKDSASPLIWFLPGILILSVDMIYRRALLSVYYPIAITIGWGVAFFVNIGLNYLLIPKFGMSGAAISSSFSYLAIALMTLTICLKFSTNKRLNTALTSN